MTGESWVDASKLNAGLMNGFDGETVTAQALEQLQASVDRDPRDCSWGLFAWADGPPACGGGVGAFQWFASQEELMAFISAWSTPCFMTYDDEAEWRDQCERLRSITAGWNQDSAATLAGLNAELKGLLQIDWIGRFADLTSSQDSFCLRVQEAFAEVDPAGADDGEAWVDFLETYGL